MRLYQYVWLLLIICFISAMPASAAEAPDPEPSAPKQISSGDELTLKRFPAVLGQNMTSNLFTRGNLAPFLIGAAGALAAAPKDQEISKSMKDHARGFGHTGGIVGAAVPLSITGGAFLSSRFSNSSHFRSFGYTVSEAYATSYILTQGIKLASHRMRPNSSASNSFPSAHASGAFSVATVVTNYYGKKWGIPLYAFAGLVGASRIEQGKHWPSDVVAGAAIGYISGKTAILGTKRELSGKKVSRLIISPSYERDTRGLSICLTY